MAQRAILTISLLLLFATPANASPTDDALAQYESVPGRPLVVRPGNTQHYAGINANLSDRSVTGRSPGEIWNLPLGGGFGITRELEVGMNIHFMLSPWAIENLLSTMRLYGRYLVVPKLLALELALHVPTTQTGNLGVEATVPLRFKSGPVEVFAQGRLLYRGSQLLDQVLIGVAASGLHTVVGDFFVIGELGFGVSPTRVNLGLGVEPTWNADWRLPVAVGGGYRILDDLFVKATFGFNDMASDRPADARFFQVTLVHAANLSGEQTAPAEEGGGEPPADPLAIPALEEDPTVPELENIPDQGVDGR